MLTIWMKVMAKGSSLGMVANFTKVLHLTIHPW